MDSLCEKPVETLDWNVDTEVQLFHAMKGHKPVGVNRYFQMACIHEKFSASLNKDISSQTIWDHLDTMYDMAALHESEILPFPNPENEFALPDNDFGDLLSKRKEKVSVDKESSKRAPSPAARSSIGGKVRVDDSSASKKPEATGGKTGKGDWNAAKSSPVPSAGGKIRRTEAEAASRSGGKSSSGTTSRKSDVGMPKHSAASSSKVKPEHAHGKVKHDSTPSHKSGRLESTASSNTKAQRGDTGNPNNQGVPRIKNKPDTKFDSKHQDDKHKQSSGKGPKGESRMDNRAESKGESKDHPRAEPKGGGGAKGDNLPLGTKLPKGKELRKSEGRGKTEDDNALAKGTGRQAKEEPHETVPKRKRTSRIDTPKSNSPQVTKSRRR
uniref:Putative chromatin modification-related protein eaf7 n=1 Tax=Hyalomma excavatum TaxID=257692 RepID=A0A131XE24_9ACAR